MPLTSVLDGVYRLDLPDEPSALVIDLPQSGTSYPLEFRPSAPLLALQRNVSQRVDELFSDAALLGGARLAALFANSFIELNRSEEEIDPTLLDAPWPGPIRPSTKTELGIGLIAAFVPGRVPVYDRKLSVHEVQDRIERYYRPYHARLDRLMHAAVERSGTAYHLNCHRMAPVGTSMSPDPGAVRADFCIGDRDGTTSGAAFRDHVGRTLGRLGYSVAINTPFAGQEILRRQGRPCENRHSLQIEVNSRLYLEPDGITPSPAFPRVQADLAALVWEALRFTRGLA